MQYKIRIQSLLVLLGLLFAFPDSFSQQCTVSLPSEPGEEVVVFADRDLYVTSEEILFSAFYTCQGASPARDLSKVLYVELLRWNGSRIANAKVLITGGEAHGAISIPSEIESGNYYLRAYTKWMRNYSPYAYTYLQLKIVNPSIAETEEGPAEALPEVERQVSLDIGGQVSFPGLKQSYGAREQVSFEIEMNEALAGDSYMLGVVRKGAKRQTGGSFKVPNDTGSVHLAAAMQYYPETRGQSLSGKIVDAGSRQPAGQVRINLSTVAEPLYFSTTVTDSAGDFLFTFPDIRGDHEFHIAVEDPRIGQLELLIDNDFCTRPVTLPYKPFFLAEDEQELVRNLALNAQIMSRFGITSTISEMPAQQRYPFYGVPDRTIYEKEYIELKNMEEFFYELVYEVDVIRKEGKVSLQMSNNGTLSGYPPLVLMDNIRIDDIDELLKVSCRRVERIEVVNRGYVVGSRFFSGIISLYSEVRDMAGMKLGEENNFFMLSLPEKREVRFPGYPGDTVPVHVPDRRNTLAWYPSLNLAADDSPGISFFTPDVPGAYTVFLEGVRGRDGALVLASADFVVE
jgi:hypothetical protein